MYLVKILKRKDAASVAVAVALGMIFVSWAPFMLGRLAGMISGISDSEGGYFNYNYPGADWQAMYLQPTVLALLQVVLLEVVLRVIVAMRSVLVRRAK